MKTIIQIVPAKSWGGGERYIYDLTEQLQKRGYNVVVVGRKSKIIADKFNEIVNYINLPLIFLFDFFSAFKLGLIIRKRNVDIIHVHIFKDAFVAIFGSILSGRKVKVIMTRHQVRKAKTGWLYNWLYRKLDRIIFVSKTAKNEFLSTNPKIDSAKITTIINSIDNSRLGKITDLDELGENAIIGFAGRISNEKGIDKLIEALSILKKDGKLFECKIAGTGDAGYVEEIKKLIHTNDLEDQVEMVGFISDMGSFISQINIAVLPSTWVEPCSLMAIEYISSGRPIVASNRGGHAEIIEDGVDGFLVEARDSKDLADGLAKLINNAQLREQLGNSAKRKYIEHLSFNLFIDKIISQYEK